MKSQINQDGIYHTGIWLVWPLMGQGFLVFIVEETDDAGIITIEVRLGICGRDIS